MEMETIDATIAGAAGSVRIDVAEGYTLRDVLIQAAQKIGLDNPVEAAGRLSPVLDSQPAELDDVVPAGAQRVTGAPAVANG